jgi:hypothetical protein
MLRDPRYVAPLAVLVVVIVLSALLRSAEPRALASTPAATPAAWPAPTATPAEQALLIDTRRTYDLARLRDIVAGVEAAGGGLPDTAGTPRRICGAARVDGCVLAGALAPGDLLDAEAPYWYASDGASYFIVMTVAAHSGDERDCARTRPPGADGPLLCVRAEVPRR